MLVTEAAQGLYGRSNMTSSLQARGHVNGGFTTPNSQPYISTRSNFNGGSQGLFPPLVAPAATQPPASGIPQRDDNIMNRRADMNSSLYQICLGLRQRLGEVPGFAPHIAEMEEEEAEVEDSTDPVTSMWNCLRRGYPLMTIYNALRPAVPLKVDPSRVAEAKIGKAATFKFLQACLTELMFPPNECFLITDLYGGDTTGFVKVTKVVNRVLDLLSQRGLLLHTEHKPANGDNGQKPQNFTYRQNVINEIVVTERDYVQHLETLQQFKNEIEESGAIAGDAVHDIFLNLNALLDFQRRFLIRIEQQNSLPESQQNWGQLFIQYQESFRVYEPFIANQTRCNEAVMKEWDKLKAAPLSPALNGLLNTQHILNGFLLKPFQRLSKYPMLLRDLRVKGGLDDERNADLQKGEASAGSILDRANEALDKEHRLAAKNELKSRVEDWKGHSMTRFGELLLYGSFTVLKGEGAKEVEREYKVYLFEHILLCCKEINPNKPKNKMLGTNKPLTDKKGKLRLQLKGRIFMQNVTDVVSLAKSEKPQYTIQIYWKGDPGVENFVIRFATEDTMNTWQRQVNAQKLKLTESAKISGQPGTSETEFTSMKNQALLENPYLQDDDAEEDDSQGSTLVEGQSNMGPSRNASSNSLHAAATLAGSSMLPLDRSTNRAPTLRFPPQELANSTYTPPLSLHTNIPPNVESPGDFGGNSYFSPTAESPMSSRSSSQTANYFLPRQATPGNGWPNDDNKHKTAPAISNTQSRDATGTLNSYAINGRTVQRPSLPAMAASQNPQQLAMAQSRLRSVSTPDIHNSNSSGPRRYANGQLQPPIDNTPVPPMPGIPLQAIRSPAPSQPLTGKEIPYPSQLKVKIWFDPAPSHVTIVVPIIIKHRSLIDRIDSKMVKISSASISNGTARLRYRDGDGDILTIASDEDVSLAIEDWALSHLQQLYQGVVGDFELYWHEN